MEEINKLQIINSSEVMGAVTSAEIDKQIATAHQYPRNLASVLQNIEFEAQMDEEVAERCYYHLERTDKNDKVTVIEGPSVRLAEIAASRWGNLRIASRVVGNDGSMVTVEAVVHDLESNVAVSQQQARSIKTKSGMTYSNDMQVMTINAAQSIAMRNAIARVVPKAFLDKVVKGCKEMVAGNATNLVDTRQRLVDSFAKLGVTNDMLLRKMKVSSLDEVTKEMVANMRGTYTALKDGATTLEEEFLNEERELKKQEAQRQAAAAAMAATKAMEKKSGEAKGKPSLFE